MARYCGGDALIGVDLALTIIGKMRIEQKLRRSGGGYFLNSGPDHSLYVGGWFVRNAKKYRHRKAVAASERDTFPAQV